MLRRFRFLALALFVLAVLAALSFPESASAQSISLSVSPTSITEEGGSQTVTVTASVTSISGPSFCFYVDVGTLTANRQTATEGTDYAAVSSKLVYFNFSNSTSTTFEVTATDDSVSDDGETIQVHSWRPTNQSCSIGLVTSYGSANLTLNDSDPKANLSVSPTEISENSGATVVTVTAALNLQGARTLGSSVTYTGKVGKTGDTATKDTDYTAGNFTVTMPSGTANAQATATFTLTPAEDSLTEGDETITVVGESTNDGNTGEATITLKNVASSCSSQSSDDLKADCAVLETLYDSAGGADWKTSTNWKTANALGRWHGVSVYDGRVASLDLESNQLTGTIPDLSSLNYLHDLHLNDNSLSGTIPALSSLAELIGLDLSNNSLSGTIPALGSLTGLNYLLLQNNELNGSIPSGLSSLTLMNNLNLSNNDLGGTIPDLNGMTNLTRLDLSDNILSGTVPDLSSTRLQILDLSDNQLTGTLSGSSLPNRICEINLSNNSLSGTVPDVSSMSGLCQLHLKGNSFTGTISASLFPNGTTGGPVVIDLSDNSLSGEIPDLGSSVSNLGYLILGNNSFSGTIPSGLGSNSSIRELDLSNNSLSGTIPDLSSLTGLGYLFLQNNSLSGTIPDLSSTRYLAQLGLWGNSGLTGDITLNSSVNLGVVDRAALIELIKKNGGSTTSLSNWVSSDMSTWEGVTVSGGRVTGLDLSGKGLAGSISNSIEALTGLTTLNLSQNTSLGGTLPLKLSEISGITTLNIQCTGIGVPTDQSFTTWLNGLTSYTPATPCGGGGSSSPPARQSQSSPPPAGEEEEDKSGRGAGGSGGVEAEAEFPQTDPEVDSGDIEAGAGGCALATGDADVPLGAAFGLLVAALVLTLAVSRRGRRQSGERRHSG